VAQLTQSMAVEVVPKGVRVNTIAPGFVPTNMTARYCTRPDGTIDDDAKAAVLAPMATFCPLRRVGVPSDIGYCLLHVASVISSFVTGRLLSPNGGGAMHYERQPQTDLTRTRATRCAPSPRRKGGPGTGPARGSSEPGRSRAKRVTPIRW
jgi:hypothetical protein